MKFRFLVFFIWALAFACGGFLRAEDDDGPLISITSPDNAVTFAYGSIKSRALIWFKKEKLLIARVTFTDAEQNIGTPNDDSHDFRLPGVMFNEAKGYFYAVSPKGDNVPVAYFRKTLFFKTIEVTRNAAIRIQRLRGNVTVILEAISPNDPALHTDGAPSDADGTHQVDINKIMQ